LLGGAAETLPMNIKQNSAATTSAITLFLMNPRDGLTLQICFHGSLTSGVSPMHSGFAAGGATSKKEWPLPFLVDHCGTSR